MENPKNIYQLIESIEKVVDDIFLNGLSSIQENIISRLKNIAKHCELQGMEHAFQLITELAAIPGQQESISADRYFKLCLYVDMMKEKLNHERILLNQKNV